MRISKGLVHVHRIIKVMFWFKFVDIFIWQFQIFHDFDLLLVQVFRYLELNLCLEISRFLGGWNYACICWYPTSFKHLFHFYALLDKFERLEVYFLLLLYRFNVQFAAFNCLAQSNIILWYDIVSVSHQIWIMIYTYFYLQIAVNSIIGGVFILTLVSFMFEKQFFTILYKFTYLNIFCWPYGFQTCTFAARTRLFDQASKSFTCIAFLFLMKKWVTLNTNSIARITFATCAADGLSLPFACRTEYYFFIFQLQIAILIRIYHVFKVNISCKINGTAIKIHFIFRLFAFIIRLFFSFVLFRTFFPHIEKVLIHEFEIFHKPLFSAFSLSSFNFLWINFWLIIAFSLTHASQIDVIFFFSFWIY